jgi:hypothetical protein
LPTYIITIVVFPYLGPPAFRADWKPGTADWTELAPVANPWGDFTLFL